MGGPLIRIEAGVSKNRLSGHIGWGISLQRIMNPIMIIAALKIRQLSLKVHLTPEQNVIQILASDRSDQALDKWM